MRKRGNRMRLLLTVLMTAFILTVCSSAFPAAGSQADLSGGSPANAPEARPDGEASPSAPDDSVRSAVNFDHELDSYVPLKDRYNFYFTYKAVHSWWDAVALGMEEAQRQYLEKGVTITYEYMAPNVASARDQTQRLLTAAEKDYDVIGVDVADEAVISPVLDEKALSLSGTVFSSSARSISASVASWPRHCLAHISTKPSTIFLPVSRVS
jgi:ribose transport system substrate-binding protein